MELQVYPDSPGVYFLVEHENVVYVGKTRSLRTVWQGSRHRLKTYDRLFYHPYPFNELDKLESSCICYFKPKYNRMVPNRSAPKKANEIVEAALKGSPLLKMRRGSEPSGQHVYDFPRPSVTVDCVVFGYDSDDASDPLKILLIRRNSPPYVGQWSLPGGFLEVSDEPNAQGESLVHAAERELNEESGITIKHLEQLYTFGEPNRDPRGRVISVAYFALVRMDEHKPIGGSDASEATWTGVTHLLKTPSQALSPLAAGLRAADDLVAPATRYRKANLAFDHESIINKAIVRLRDKIRYSPIGLNLLPSEFTLSELRHVYEAILGGKIDASNFGKRVLATNVLISHGTRQSGSGRPAVTYSFDPKAYTDATFNLDINVKEE
jgi:8-oxo-dGTP diphosphatase